jgi:Spy/CpxP family protein refolding chaperone
MAPERGGGAVTGRSTAGIVLVLCLVVGGLAGVVVDRSVLIPHRIGRPPHGNRPFWPSGQMSQDRFVRDLNLTPAQRARFDSIMSRQVARFRSTRERIQPAMDSIVAETRAELDSLLTPAQRDQLRGMRDRNAFGFPFASGRPPDSLGWRRRFHGPGSARGDSSR